MGEHVVGRFREDHRSLLKGDELVAQRAKQGDVMLDDDDCAACVGLNLAQEGPERLGLLLSDAAEGSSSRTTAGSWASMQANSTMRRVPVDRSAVGTSAKPPRPSRPTSS
jgi:hypothetical protein